MGGLSESENSRVIFRAEAEAAGITVAEVFGVEGMAGWNASPLQLDNDPRQTVYKADKIRTTRVELPCHRDL